MALAAEPRHARAAARRGAPARAGGARRAPRSCWPSAAIAGALDTRARPTCAHVDRRLVEIARALATRPATCCCSTSPRPACRARTRRAWPRCCARIARRRHRRAAGRARHGAGDGHLATRSWCSMPASASPPARRPRCRPTPRCARPISARRWRCSRADARRRRRATRPRAAGRRRAGRRLRRRRRCCTASTCRCGAARWWRCWAPTAPASRR